MQRQQILKETARLALDVADEKGYVTTYDIQDRLLDKYSGKAIGYYVEDGFKFADDLFDDFYFDERKQIGILY